jgi:transposase
MSSNLAVEELPMERTLRMSQKERTRLYEVKLVEEGKEKMKDMSAKLGISYRQTRRIVKRYKEEGDAGLCHRSRGRESNRKLPDTIRRLAVDLEKGKCKGWGPTLLSETMDRVYRAKADHETVRRILMEEGLHKKRRKSSGHRSRRERKEHFGELIQMDGSFHRWLQDADDKQCLMVMIDDATSTRMAYLCEEETTMDAMLVLRKWIKKYGMPKALYTDYKNVYLHDPKTAERLGAKGEEVLTQFGRACAKLGIGIIGASSPQAKGRVERANGVFQDRLIKELAFRGIKTVEGANRFLEEEHLDFLNRKFSKLPKSDVDYHRATPTNEELDSALAIQEKRTVANDWTVRFRNRVYQILNCNRNLPPAKSNVMVLEKLDGSLHFIYRDREMEVNDITHMERPKKETGKQKTAKRFTKSCKPSLNHPWRGFRFGSADERSRP